MSADRPSLRIVHGHPSPEEVAVVTAVLTAVATSGPVAPEPAVQRGRWADPFDQHRRPWQTGLGGWRAAVR